MSRPPPLSHDADANSLMMGCGGCHFRAECGGLRVRAGIFDCFTHCCGGKDNCDVVCPKKPSQFAANLREVGGFDLAKDVPPSLIHTKSELPGFIPLLQHASSRSRRLATPAAALSLFEILQRGTSTLKHADRDALDSAYKLQPGGALFLTGTAEDAPLERWWSLGTIERRNAARAIAGLAPALVTSPNYSLFKDNPRTDDLHSMKRIVIAWEELNSAGLPCALHVNARTDFDFERWTKFIASRPEIQFISWEFATGGREGQRALWQSEQLCHLASSVGRPLGLVVRGGLKYLPALLGAFDSIQLIETSVFMKSMNRQQATAANGRIVWATEPTALGQPVDDLMEKNLRIVGDHLDRVLRRN